MNSEKLPFLYVFPKTKKNTINKKLQMNINLRFDIRRVVVSLICILALDAIWLTISRDFYNIQDPKIYYGLIAWISLSIAISCGNPSSIKEAYKYGALIGFVSYATFNGTELAIHPSWRHPYYKSFVDMCWGTFACSTTSILLYRFHMYVNDTPNDKND